jgi:D-amino peptidase
MKWYVLTDLEGPCRVNRWEQTRSAELTPAKRDAMTLLTNEVNAVVDGLFDADPAAQVVVWDGHGNGGLDLLALHPRAALIARGAGIRAPYHLDAGFAGLLFVGQHAMAGTPQGTLAHTYSSQTVEFFQLNGHFIGEFGCRAVMAGALGVPTVFVAGDNLACAEARALVPGIVTVDTKVCLGEELALHHPLAQVHAELRSRAALAVQRVREIAPVVWPRPYTLRTRVLPGCGLAGYLARAGVRQLDERTVEATADVPWELWI